MWKKQLDQTLQVSAETQDFCLQRALSAFKDWTKINIWQVKPDKFQVELM